MISPAIPAFSPWSSACSPRVAETVLWLISASLIGSAPIRSTSARSLTCWGVKLPEICAPVRPSIPSGFSSKLMIGARLDLVVEHDREAVGELRRGVGVDRRRGQPGRERRVGAAQGDLAGHLLERLAPLVGEVEGDVGLIGGRVQARLGVLDVVAGQRRGVVEDEELRAGAVRLVALGARIVLGRLPRRRPCPAGPRSPASSAAGGRRRGGRGRTCDRRARRAARACRRRRGSRWARSVVQSCFSHC